jgi:hypothetical protein
MLQAQSLEIGTTGALGWTSKAAGERMWKMTTPAAIPTLRPMLRSIGHHHLDHPRTTPLHDQDRSWNLPEEALQPLMRKTRKNINGMEEKREEEDEEEDKWHRRKGILREYIEHPQRPGVLVSVDALRRV